jgi:hypothetical protein
MDGNIFISLSMKYSLQSSKKSSSSLTAAVLMAPFRSSYKLKAQVLLAELPQA